MDKLQMRGNESLEIRGDAVVAIADGTHGSVVIRPSGAASVELHIGKGCGIKTYLIAESSAEVRQSNRIGEGSRVDSFSLWLEGGSGRVLNSLEGPRSEAYDVQVFVEKGEKKLHIDSVLRHAGRDTKGNILVKGIVRDKASAKLDGMIKIEKGGGGAQSFLSEHVMLLNPGAHASAKPELEIENNDVSSRHAASVSQIDEEKIFYLVSRGLPREEAKRLIVEGFLESAISRVGEEGMRKLLMERTMAAV